jgi:hypothetical protein
MTADEPPTSLSLPRSRPVRSRPPLLRALAEFFSLRSRKAVALARSYTRTEPGFAEFQLGIRALRDGLQTGYAHQGTETGLLVVRSATRLLVRAAALRGGPLPLGANWADVWAFAKRQPTWSALAALPEPDAARLSAILEDSGESAVATLAPAERRSALAAMSAHARRVAAPLEYDALALRHVTRQRWLRMALVATAVGALLGLSHLARRPNLALHRPVVASDSDPTFGVDPQRVVDGDRSNLGFHTTDRADAMITIDLGTVRRITRVDVYNRADCCQERVVPLALELSDDGKDYRFVTRNDRVFDLWRVRLPSPTMARFVRLKHETAAPFHLSEVEVY